MQTKNVNLTLTNGTTKNMLLGSPLKNITETAHESNVFSTDANLIENSGYYEPIGTTSPIYVSMPSNAKFRSTNGSSNFNGYTTSAPSAGPNNANPVISTPGNGQAGKGIYQPPPLPPRVGSLMRDMQTFPSPEGSQFIVSSAPSTSSANVLCNGGPYKPVPPPKPFAGYTSQMHYLQENQDSFPPVRNGGPVSYPHILVTDQGQFVTHSTKFPIAEESQKLVFKGNSRFNGGIDNPSMLPEADIRLGVNNTLNKDPSVNHYAQMNTNYDSSGRVPYSVQNRSQYGNHVPSTYSTTSNGQPITTTESWPNNHLITQNGSLIGAHQSPDKRHYQQSHQQQVNSVNSRPSHLPNVPTSQQNGNARTISFAPAATILNHQELYNEHISNSCNSRPSTAQHSHMNGGPTSSQYTKDSANVTMISQDEHSTNADNEDNENRKDDTKWGSLKKAGKTYSHLKNILSNKFNRSEIKGSGEENNCGQSQGSQPVSKNAPQAAETTAKNSAPEFLQSAERLQINGRHLLEMQTNFQRAVQYSSLKARLEDHAPPPRQDSSIYIMSDRKMSSNGPMSYHNSAQMPMYRQPNEALASKRAESCSHLGSRGMEPPPQLPCWSNHHRSDENLSRALPSDHPYPDLKNKTASIHQLPLPRDGRVGSDSGRGTGGSGTEFKGHDTSLESGSSNRPHLNGQSSGNESEWIDIPDTETSSRIPYGLRNGRFNYDAGASTPPLPPLSPEGSPKISHKFTDKERKQSHSFSLRANGKPDLLEATGSKGNECPNKGSSSGADAANQGPLCRSTSLLPSSVKGWTSKNATTAPDSSKRVATKNEMNKKNNHQNDNGGRIPSNMVSNGGGAWKPFLIGGRREYGNVDDEAVSTDDALDLNSMLDGCTEATTDDDLASRDDEAYVIRRQLEGLEGMYSEVLKALGSRRQGRQGESRLLRRRLHGSMSSLPSSVMSSRPMTKDKKGRGVIDDRVRKATKEPPSKTIHKRFQRLESHVVTLARSVAHLSSEMRTQHLMLQEMESIRNELSSLRVATRTIGTAPHTKGNNNGRVENTLWNPIESGHLALSNPGRVKKLTQFFGDEPPLVRIFLRKLGYEKYAKVFEEEKIGMLELPYLTEERLQKIGIPLGPRLRILQEAQGPIKREGNLSVYVV